MTAQLRVEADLRLTVDVPATDDGPAGRWSARIQGAGQDIEVVLDRLDGLPVGLGRRAATDLAADLAEAAAEAGLTLSVVGPRGPILSLGSVRAGLLDRAVTGSRHVAIRDRRAALQLLRGSRRSGPSVADLTPPGTPWPPAPTLAPVLRRRVRTTHDPAGGGRPRLVYYLPPGPGQGAPRETAYLRRGTTTIGSAPDSDVRIPGLRPQHAEIRRDPTTDEYLLHALGPEPATVAGEQATEGRVLRTGATLACGTQTFVYVRDEYADHGRPFGGREGGEFSRQRPQRRPRYES